MLFNRGELDRVEEFVTEDFVNHEAWPGEDPGYEGFRLRLGRLRSAIPDIHMEIHEVVAGDDLVAYRATLSGTHRGRAARHAPHGPLLRRPAHAHAADARRALERALGHPRRSRDAAAARDHPSGRRAAREIPDALGREPQQRVQRTRVVEGLDVVVAADGAVVDQDLRDRVAAR